MFTAAARSGGCTHVSDFQCWGTQQCVIKRNIIIFLSAFWYCCSIWRNLQHAQWRALVFSKGPQSTALLLYLLCMKTPSVARVSIVKVSWQTSMESCCSLLLFALQHWSHFLLIKGHLAGLRVTITVVIFMGVMCRPSKFVPWRSHFVCHVALSVALTVKTAL